MFGDREVNAVKRQFDKVSKGRWRFHCLTDRPSQDWHIPLVCNLPGWWSILESFRTTGPAILTGLDTLLVGDLEPLFDIAESCPEDTLYGIRDFYRPDRWASGVTIWNGDWSGLLGAFRPEHMKQFRGNQDYTEHAVKHMPTEIGKHGKLAYLQDSVSGIISYKRDIRDRKPRRTSLPEGTRICCFHGKPRPWDAIREEPWIADYLTPAPPADETCGLSTRAAGASS
ncbi:hypothetical protein AYO49_06330 [Verrucomicrobiaceae bacterium SCGC AG-212-N21]|nr:hypothetical protein AYO49_06330 [Verrucomicrobiaceae bacterium SCGC AG-212-N21]